MRRETDLCAVLEDRPRLFLAIVVGAGLGLAAPSCVTETASQCTPGYESCACAQGGLCIVGLECVSGYCVNTGGGNGDGTGDTGVGDGDTGMGDGDTGGEDGIGICETLIACAQEVEPSVSTMLIATYGPEGTCWDLPGVEPIDCMRECRALLEGYRTLDPAALECGECSAESDCSSPVFGSDTLCVGLNIGTGVGICIEPIAECDLATVFPYLPPRDGSCDYLPGEYELVLSPDEAHGFCSVDCPPSCPHGWYCASTSPYVCAQQCSDCDCGMECVAWDQFSEFCAYPL